MPEIKSLDWPKIILSALAGFVFLSTTFSIGYWYGIQQIQQVKEPTPWQDYKNNGLGLEFKYPPEFSVEQEDNFLTIYSPQYLCRVKGSKAKLEKTSEITITVTLREGESFEKTWLDTFGFPFTGGDSYDGIETIGGKKAYYFYQGAEMPFGREVYLIELTPAKALEVNIFTPSYAFECEGQIQEFSQHPKYVNLANQILSTLKFLDQQKTYKNENFGSFEISYPSDWYLTYSYMSVAVFSSTTPSQRNYGATPLPEGTAEIRTDVRYKSNSLTLDEWALMVGLNPHVQTRNQLSYSNIEVVGIQGRNLAYSAPDDKQVGRIVFIPKEEFTESGQAVIVLNLYYFANDSSADYYNQVFNQFLSSFKLLD